MQMTLFEIETPSLFVCHSEECERMGAAPRPPVTFFRVAIESCFCSGGAILAIDSGVKSEFPVQMNLVARRARLIQGSSLISMSDGKAEGRLEPLGKLCPVPCPPCHLPSSLCMPANLIR